MFDMEKESIFKENTLAEFLDINYLKINQSKHLEKAFKTYFRLEQSWFVCLFVCLIVCRIFIHITERKVNMEQGNDKIKTQGYKICSSELSKFLKLFDKTHVLRNPCDILHMG